jgi:hypothetical protein
MKRILTRIIGILLVISGILGLVFAVVALFGLVQVQRQMETAIQQQMEMIDRTLVATADGLKVAETSVAQANDTVASLQSVVSGVGKAMGDTVPMVDGVSQLLGNQLPATIESTQSTLSGVAKSAKVIDNVLQVLTAIPFLSIERYNPDVPLSQGVQDVSDSLTDIPTSLKQSAQGLAAAGDSLQAAQGEVNRMADSVGQITTSLDTARGVVVQYQGVVGDLQKMITAVRQGLPRWLTYLRWGISLILLWLGIVQFALITQGWELIGRSRKQQD